MPSIDEVLSRSLEFALQGDFQRAQAELAGRTEPLALQIASLFRHLEVYERERASAMTKARHEIGNALSIAQASIEAMLDGVVSITDPRLNRIRDILASVSASMYELTSESPRREQSGVEPNGGDPIASEVDALAALAEIKGVRLVYDAAPETRAGMLIRNGTAKETFRKSLLDALRRTPAGGTIRVGWSAADEVVLEISKENGSKSTVLVTL